MSSRRRAPCTASPKRCPSPSRRRGSRPRRLTATRSRYARIFCAIRWRISAELCGIALRYFNPIGAHPSALIGELPKGVPGNLVPFITQTAAGIRECLSVFGDDYDTPDGSAIRDYIDVVDLAKAHVVAVGRMIGGKGKNRYEYFNIGTGRGRSVLELVSLFERATGVRVPHKIVGRRTGDIEKIWADTSYANRELGWKAERSIEDTLRSAWAWEKRLRGIE